MKDRIKWMLVGLGFAFGLQVIISLIFTAILRSTAQRGSDLLQQGTMLLLFFGFTLGAFLVGGFVIGWMSEEKSIPDAIAVAIITLALSAGVYMALPEGTRVQFVTGNWLSDANSQLAFTGRSALFVALALIASAAGAYLGWHVNVPEESALDRVALLIGLIGAIVGPFVLLAVSGGDPTRTEQPNLPWYFLAIVLVLLLVIVGVGFVMFTRETSYEDEISISPEHRRDLNQHGTSKA